MNPIHVDITFYMPITKLVKDKKEAFFHVSAPFIDNLYRFVLDAMKDVLIVDDRVICSLSLKKVYDKEPRTEMTIIEVV